MKIAKLNYKSKDIKQYPNGIKSTILICKCIDNWIYTNEAIPECNKKLLILTDGGTVCPGLYYGKERAFAARLKFGRYSTVFPVAWRLFPAAPGNEPDKDATLRIISFEKHEL